MALSKSIDSKHNCFIVKHYAEPPFPVLNQDILRIIFTHMTTKDRVPLALVNKEFHDIDLDIGKRYFDSVEIEMEEGGRIRVIAKSTSGQYIFTSKPDDKFFKSANVDTLNIYVRENIVPNVKCIPSLFESAIFKNITVHGTVNQDCSNVLLRLFAGMNVGRNSLKSVKINWMCTVRQNLTRLRRALQQLPTMEHLEVSYAVMKFLERDVEFFNTQDNFLLDGPTMIHAVEKAVNAELDNVDCTADDVLQAFEIVCKSTVDSKFVRLCILPSVLHELPKAARKTKSFEVSVSPVGDTAVIDQSRRAMMITVGVDEGTIVLMMCKIDKDGNPITELARALANFAD